MTKAKKCETCTHYNHTPNILGGVAKCMKEVKFLNTFYPNDACDIYEPTEHDNLKAQNDYYKEHLDGAIQLTKN